MRFGIERNSLNPLDYSWETGYITELIYMFSILQ
jgi:hypothetical protein